MKLFYDLRTGQLSLVGLSKKEASPLIHMGWVWARGTDGDKSRVVCLPENNPNEFLNNWIARGFSYFRVEEDGSASFLCSK